MSTRPSKIRGRYFQLNLIHGDHENPEYRIAEDLRVATEGPVEFAVGLILALFSAVTFTVVLWTGERSTSTSSEEGSRFRASSSSEPWVGRCSRASLWRSSDAASSPPRNARTRRKPISATS